MIIEVWQAENGVVAFPSTASDKDRQVFLDPIVEWNKLREIEGATWEDAMTQHHQIMGWEPYVPMDDSTAIEMMSGVSWR
jgi:hypothetical protein